METLTADVMARLGSIDPDDVVLRNDLHQYPPRAQTQAMAVFRELCDGVGRCPGDFGRLVRDLNWNPSGRGVASVFRYLCHNSPRRAALLLGGLRLTPGEVAALGRSLRGGFTPAEADVLDTYDAFRTREAVAAAIKATLVPVGH